MIELRLARSGWDVAALQATGKLVVLDAQQVLDQLLLDEVPNRERFQAHVVGRVRRLAEAVQPHMVYAYGEMVDILWSAGKRDAVIELEQLWSELIDEQRGRRSGTRCTADRRARREGRRRVRLFGLLAHARCRRAAAARGAA
jgi:hypothetical protein